MRSVLRFIVSIVFLSTIAFHHRREGL
jgi:hypothetical protein